MGYEYRCTPILRIRDKWSFVLHSNVLGPFQRCHCRNVFCSVELGGGWNLVGLEG